MNDSSQKILIVGAGPTGLTAAVELARRGITPRIVDGAPGPTQLSKAVGISPKSLELLEPAGVTGRLLARGIRVRRAHLHFGESELGAVDLGMLEHRYDFLLSLPQCDTETIMAWILDGLGVPVHWRTRLTWLEPMANGTLAVLDGAAGRQSIYCTHVFGADGVHSTVRNVLGLGFEGFTHARTWSIADFEVTDWSYKRDEAHLFLHPGGDIGFIIPVGTNRFRAVSNTDDAMAQIAGIRRDARVRRIDTFRIPVRQASTYQKGNVFLGGDAAHVQSPVGARGMNLGIEDAACFVRRLINGTLAGYTAERRPVGRQWIQLSERVLRLAQAEGSTRTTLRNLALRVAGQFPILQKPALERVAGLRE